MIFIESMATRLSVKRKKQQRDRKTAYSKNPAPKKHKIDRARSKKMKKKKLNRA